LSKKIKSDGELYIGEGVMPNNAGEDIKYTIIGKDRLRGKQIDGRWYRVVDPAEIWLSKDQFERLRVLLK